LLAKRCSGYRCFLRVAALGFICVSSATGKEKENCVGSENHSPHYSREKSYFGTEYRKAPPPLKAKEKSMGIKRVAGLA
jgi:hypothetical protein